MHETTTIKPLPRTSLREGYAADEVDAFLRSLTDAEPETSIGRIAKVTFASSRFGRRYDYDDVDRLLDEVSVSLGGQPVPWASCSCVRDGLPEREAATSVSGRFSRGAIARDTPSDRQHKIDTILAATPGWCTEAREEYIFRRPSLTVIEYLADASRRAARAVTIASNISTAAILALPVLAFLVVVGSVPWQGLLIPLGALAVSVAVFSVYVAAVTTRAILADRAYTLNLVAALDPSDAPKHDQEVVS